MKSLQDHNFDRHLHTVVISNAKLQSFEPVTPANARCLILGSMPGTASLDANQYYAHPRNGFWKILQSIYDGDIETYEHRLKLLERNRIALWDSLKHCQRPGSLDSNIATDSVECNDFNTLLQQNPTIKLIAFNGKAAEKWFRKLALPGLDTADTCTMVSLPSSSPAMAMLSVEEKTEQWRTALTTS